MSVQPFRLRAESLPKEFEQIHANLWDFKNKHKAMCGDEEIRMICISWRIRDILSEFIELYCKRKIYGKCK